MNGIEVVGRERRGAGQNAAPNVVPTCRVQLIVATETGAVWRTVAQCLYTPAAIDRALAEAGVAWGWVLWLGGRETWERGAGGVARQR